MSGDKFRNTQIKSKETQIWQGHPAFINYIGHFMLAFFLIFFYGLGILYFIWIFLDRNARRYVITNKKVTVRRGIIANHTDEVEISHVRSINMRQGAIDRIFGIGTVYLGTAGTGKMEIAIAGISTPKKIKEEISKLIN